MNREQLDVYRKKLRETADRAAGSAAGLEEQVRTPTSGEVAGGLSNAPLHLGDVGSEAYNQELGATLLENETYIRDEAMAALERIDRGTFGRCENCGTPIPEERLEILPYTRYCVPCASKLQAGRLVNLNEGRPETWLGEPGREGKNQTGSPARVVGRELGGGPGDVHAAGTPGGGSALGGLAGTNVGGGRPDGANLEEAMGSGKNDTTARADDAEEEAPQALAGQAGGAVGGTPANKRARGGRSVAKGEGGSRSKPGKKPGGKRGKK